MGVLPGEIYCLGKRASLQQFLAFFLSWHIQLTIKPVVHQPSGKEISISQGRPVPIFLRLISPNKNPVFILPRVLLGTTEHFVLETLKWVRTADLELNSDLPKFTATVLG